MGKFIGRSLVIGLSGFLIIPILVFTTIVLMIKNVIAGDPMLERWERLATVLKKAGIAIKIYFKTGEVDSFHEI